MTNGMHIDKAWNGYIINAGTAQTEVYKTLPEVLTRIVEVFGIYRYTPDGLTRVRELMEIAYQHPQATACGAKGTA